MNQDRRVLLSSLWVFVMFNYIYADILMLIVNPAAYQRAAAQMTPGIVLVFAALMEVPILMALLSPFLEYRANRWANIIAGVESTAFVAVTLVGRPPAFYIFFSTIEIACTAFIVWFAWTWRRPGGQPLK